MSLAVRPLLQFSGYQILIGSPQQLQKAEKKLVEKGQGSQTAVEVLRFENKGLFQSDESADTLSLHYGKENNDAVKKLKQELNTGPYKNSFKQLLDSIFGQGIEPNHANEVAVVYTGEDAMKASQFKGASKQLKERAQSVMTALTKKQQAGQPLMEELHALVNVFTKGDLAKGVNQLLTEQAGPLVKKLNAAKTESEREKILEEFLNIDTKQLERHFVHLTDQNQELETAINKLWDTLMKNGRMLSALVNTKVRKTPLLQKESTLNRINKEMKEGFDNILDSQVIKEQLTPELIGTLQTYKDFITDVSTGAAVLATDIPGQLNHYSATPSMMSAKAFEEQLDSIKKLDPGRYEPIISNSGKIPTQALQDMETFLQEQSRVDSPFQNIFKELNELSTQKQSTGNAA